MKISTSKPNRPFNPKFFISKLLISLFTSISNMLRFQFSLSVTNNSSFLGQKFWSHFLLSFFPPTPYNYPSRSHISPIYKLHPASNHFSLFPLLSTTLVQELQFTAVASSLVSPTSALVLLIVFS